VTDLKGTTHTTYSDQNLPVTFTVGGQAFVRMTDFSGVAHLLLTLAAIKFGADMVGAVACDALIGERQA
jgi:hypothetical protein